MCVSPLIEIRKLSGESIVLLQQSRRAIRISIIAKIVTITVLLLYSRHDMASTAVGISSIFVTIVYVGITYLCYSKLKSVKLNTGSAQMKSYTNIGKFLFGLGLMFGVAHLLQATVYLSSVFLPDWYRTNFAIMQLCFLWADVISIFASLSYVSRSLWTVKLNQKRVKACMALQKMPRKPPQVHNEIHIALDRPMETHNDDIIDVGITVLAPSVWEQQLENSADVL